MSAATILARLSCGFVFGVCMRQIHRNAITGLKGMHVNIYQEDAITAECLPESVYRFTVLALSVHEGAQFLGYWIGHSFFFFLFPP